MPDAGLANEDYCYLTTTGRVSGRPHELEIWFAIEGKTVYLLSGGRDRSDWVKNLRRSPDARVRIGETTWEARGRILGAGTEEDALARRLLFEKYAPRYSGDLSDWRRTALPVALDLGRRVS